MANPKLENGYTSIENEVLERLAKTRIPGEAGQVLNFVLRKTYGWHKKEDAISLSQFVEGTGLSKVHICRAIRILKKMKLLTQDNTFTQLGNTTFTQKGKAISQVYEFNKNFDLWQPLPKKVTLPKKVKVVTQKGQIPLPKKDTTKETIQKKLLQKKTTLAEPSGSLPIDKEIIKKPNPDIKIFIDWYSDWFLSVFDEKPLIEGGKDGTIVRRLLGTYGLEKLKGLAEAFFESDDEFIQKTGYTIGVFSKVINKLLINKRGLSKKVPKGWQAIKNYLEEAEREKPDLCEGDGITE